MSWKNVDIGGFYHLESQILHFNWQTLTNACALSLNLSIAGLHECRGIEIGSAFRFLRTSYSPSTRNWYLAYRKNNFDATLLFEKISLAVKDILHKGDRIIVLSQDISTFLWLSYFMNKVTKYLFVSKYLKIYFTFSY